MKLFILVLFIVIIGFSASLSYYLTNYKLKPSSLFMKTIAFLLLASVNALITITACVLVLWPV